MYVIKTVVTPTFPNRCPRRPSPPQAPPAQGCPASSRSPTSPCRSPPPRSPKSNPHLFQVVIDLQLFLFGLLELLVEHLQALNGCQSLLFQARLVDPSHLDVLFPQLQDQLDEPVQQVEGQVVVLNLFRVHFF